MEGNIALVAFQPNKAGAKIQVNLIHLPHNNYRQQGYRDQGGQVKESV